MYRSAFQKIKLVTNNFQSSFELPKVRYDLDNVIN